MYRTGGDNTCGVKSRYQDPSYTPKVDMQNLEDDIRRVSHKMDQKEGYIFTGQLSSYIRPSYWDINRALGGYGYSPNVLRPYVVGGYPGEFLYDYGQFVPSGARGAVDGYKTLNSGYNPLSPEYYEPTN